MEKIIRTPLRDYFSDEGRIYILEEVYNIKSMEQLLSLKNTSVGIKGIAEVIDMDDNVLDSILYAAEKELRIPKRSNRKYSFGAFRGRPER